MNSAKKNIVFLHLESLNQLIFNQRYLFPNLNNIYSRSVRFNNFMSSATSSLMAFSDLLHGDDNTLEHNMQLEENISIKRNSMSIFDRLTSEGYNTSGLGYPKNWANVDSIWSETNKFNWHDTAGEMFSEVQSVVSGEQPFALYLWNLSSHLCYSDNIKNSADNSMDRWSKGYQSMDLMIGHIINILIKEKKIDNTIIIGVGDHGDDFWNHGFNGGYAHGIEPYTSLIHTPAFIFSTGMKSCDMNHMVSMIDLHDTILALLGLPPASPTGYDHFALAPKRKYCFSRNLFAKQKSQHNGSPLKKGYAITSDNFHLMKIDGEYKMFAWKVDPTNHLDILTLLKYDSSGRPFIDFEKINLQRVGGAHPHMKHFFNAGMVTLISESYDLMKQKLDCWIEDKNSKVMMDY